MLELTTDVVVRSRADRPPGDGLLEEAEQLTAKDLGEHAHGQEEVAAGGDQAGFFDVEPPAGDDAVEMRMVEQQLGPGVQDRGEARVAPSRRRATSWSVVAAAVNSRR